MDYTSHWVEENKWTYTPHWGEPNKWTYTPHPGTEYMDYTPHPRVQENTLTQPTWGEEEN